MPPPIEFLSRPRRLRLYSEITTAQHVLDTPMGPMVLFRGDLILKDTQTGELVPMRAADVEHLVIPLSLGAAALYDAAAKRAAAAPSAEVLEHAQAVAEWAAGERMAGVEGNWLDSFNPQPAGGDVARWRYTLPQVPTHIPSPSAGYEDVRTLATVPAERTIDTSTTQLTEAELAALSDEGGMNKPTLPGPAVRSMLRDALRRPTDQVSEALALGDCTPGAQRGFEFDEQWDPRTEPLPPAGEKGRREAA